VASRESSGVGVLPLSECICLPRIGEIVCVGTGVAVEDPDVRVIPRYVRIEIGRRAPVREGHAGLGPG